MYVCMCLQVPEETKELPGAGATGGFEYTDAGIKPSLQSALLNTKPSFWPLPSSF